MKTVPKFPKLNRVSILLSFRCTVAHCYWKKHLFVHFYLTRFLLLNSSSFLYLITVQNIEIKQSYDRIEPTIIKLDTVKFSVALPTELYFHVEIMIIESQILYCNKKLGGKNLVKFRRNIPLMIFS